MASIDKTANYIDYDDDEYRDLCGAVAEWPRGAGHSHQVCSDPEKHKRAEEFEHNLYKMLDRVTGQPFGVLRDPGEVQS